MRIGVDCRFSDVRAGLGTYTREIVPELLTHLTGHQAILFGRTKPWFDLPAHAKWVQADMAPYSAAEQSALPNLIQREAIDLFYVPHFNVPLLLTVPCVPTVHDLILHRHPGDAGFLKKLAYKKVMKNAVKKSKSLITISTATKHDIIEHYGQKSGEKTSVIYPGVSSVFQPASEDEKECVRQKYQLDQPYLLYVGGCKEHKNVQMLIDAFSDAELEPIKLALVVSGKECRHLKKKEHVSFLLDVEDADLPALYSASLGSVTATKDEGFYLPAIEAMSCKCPVMATDIGPIPEVCGDYALLVEPIRVALTSGIRDFVTRDDLRMKAKLDAAKEWSKKYSWSDSATEIARVILN